MILPIKMQAILIRGSWRGGGGYQSHFPAHLFRNPTSQCSNPIPTGRIWKKSQCYTCHLFSLCIRKITASKYDPTKTQKFTRIYKDVLKITGSFQTVIKLSSSEFKAISPCHFTFLPFLNPLRLLDLSMPHILRIFFSIWVVEQSNGKFNLQFPVCITTFLVQKYLISTTTVRVVNSAPAVAPAMLFVSYKYTKYTCHVDFWFYTHRCTQISLTANRGHSGET